MYTITNVGGTPGGEAFLLVTEEKAALIDSGFACSAGRMVANIKDILQDRPLDYAVSYTHLDVYKRQRIARNTRGQFPVPDLMFQHLGNIPKGTVPCLSLIHI